MVADISMFRMGNMKGIQLVKDVVEANSWLLSPEHQSVLVKPDILFNFLSPSRTDNALINKRWEGVRWSQGKSFNWPRLGQSEVRLTRVMMQSGQDCLLTSNSSSLSIFSQDTRSCYCNISSPGVNPSPPVISALSSPMCLTPLSQYLVKERRKLEI